MNTKGYRILFMLQKKQMTRAEIAHALNEDISAINDLVDTLHTHFQYIRLSIVSDGDIISTEPPAPKYSLTPAGQAYLMSIRQAKCSQLTLAAASALALLCLSGIMRNIHNRCFAFFKAEYERDDTASLYKSGAEHHK
jgi:hypothetical protein